MRCDLAVMPTKAGLLEADPLVETVRILRQAQELRHGKPDGKVVFSQIGKGRRGKPRVMVRQMQLLAADLQLPLATTPVYLSEFHPQACYYDTFVWNMGTKACELANDLDQLFYELLPETVPLKRANQ